MPSSSPERKPLKAANVPPTRKPSMKFSVQSGVLRSTTESSWRTSFWLEMNMLSGRDCSQFLTTRGRVLLPQTTTPSWPTSCIASMPGLTICTPVTASPPFHRPSSWRSAKSGSSSGNRTAARLLALIVFLPPPWSIVPCVEGTNWPLC